MCIDRLPGNKQCLHFEVSSDEELATHGCGSNWRELRSDCVYLASRETRAGVLEETGFSRGIRIKKQRKKRHGALRLVKMHLLTAGHPMTFSTRQVLLRFIALSFAPPRSSLVPWGNSAEHFSCSSVILPSSTTSTTSTACVSHPTTHVFRFLTNHPRFSHPTSHRTPDSSLANKDESLRHHIPICDGPQTSADLGVTMVDSCFILWLKTQYDTKTLLPLLASSSLKGTKLRLPRYLSGLISL